MGLFILEVQSISSILQTGLLKCSVVILNTKYKT